MNARLLIALAAAALSGCGQIEAWDTVGRCDLLAKAIVDRTMPLTRQNDSTALREERRAAKGQAAALCIANHIEGKRP